MGDRCGALWKKFALGKYVIPYIPPKCIANLFEDQRRNEVERILEQKLREQGE